MAQPRPAPKSALPKSQFQRELQHQLRLPAHTFTVTPSLALSHPLSHSHTLSRTLTPFLCTHSAHIHTLSRTLTPSPCTHSAPIHTLSRTLSLSLSTLSPVLVAPTCTYSPHSQRTLSTYSNTLSRTLALSLCPLSYERSTLVGLQNLKLETRGHGSAVERGNKNFKGFKNFRIEKMSQSRPASGLDWLFFFSFAL
jgi:hypothetical protein